MEKTMSVEDKIRRAEEIYYRRQGMANAHVNNSTTIPVGKKQKRNLKLFKKIIIQMLICLALYSSFYVVKNNNYIFSEDFIKKANEILSQDIDFNKIYSAVSTKINEFIELDKKQNETTNETTQDEENSNNQITQNENNNIEENVINNEETSMTEEKLLTNEENIGGAVEEVIEESQMEQDANFIKSTVSFIKPVEGEITSVYGLRNPTTASVPKDHTGTDIAANTGTKILSATDGTVILASSDGDYRKTLKNTDK